MKKKILAFTLGNILICLAIVCILIIILILLLQGNIDDTNILKFQKANTELNKAINNLVSDGTKYATGDLGRKPDGSYVTETNYLCNTLAGALGAKTSSCQSKKTDSSFGKNISPAWETENYNPYSLSTGTVANYLDFFCKTINTNSSIVTTQDGISYIELAPMPYGSYSGEGSASFFYQKKTGAAKYANMQDNEYTEYKIMCVDIDNFIPASNKNCDDKTDICPFGYGLRIDGKILPGARATKWLKKGKFMSLIIL